MLREVARRVGAGRIVYHTWHAPRGSLRKLRNEGVVNLALTRLGRTSMERAAERLAPLSKPPIDAPEIYYLSGRRFAYQTAFCAVSLGRQAGKPMRVVVVDDGTLTEYNVALLKHLLPGLRLVRSAEAEASVEACLPSGRFPELRHRRLVYPHLRKLVDVHAGGGGWKLVLDSDMLFHRRPDFLLEWLVAPDKPCYMVDVIDAYGYSARLLHKLAGADLPRRLNVGICALNSDAIDWDKLENWCRTLVTSEGTHYLLEQALVAMLTAGIRCTVAPSHEYVVAPSRAEAERPTAVLHHYTAESKAWYFRFAWRHVATAATCTWGGAGIHGGALS
jgi:hypothetical protein